MTWNHTVIHAKAEQQTCTKMLPAALFVVAKDWKQFKCLSGVLGQWNTL